jgi:hypothetical protein
MNVRDVKILVHLCDIFPEMSTDSGEFFSVDTDDAKLIYLGYIEQPEECTCIYECTLPSLRRSNKVNATT